MFRITNFLKGTPLLAFVFIFLCSMQVTAGDHAGGEKTYPFVETFEGGVFPPSGWVTYSLLNNSLNWELDPWTNHTVGGTNSAFHNQSSEFTLDNWMVTPQISLPTEGFYYLSFWSWLANNWSYKKSSILVSTGSPDPADNDYVEVWTLTETNNAWAWYQYFVNLESYAGQSIYIAFRYEGDPWGHTWYLDDISLGEEIDDSPVLTVSSLEVYQGLGLNGTGTKNLTITNDGILNLDFEASISYINAEGWLSVNPVSGSLGTHASSELTLDFNAAGLEYGTYQANLNLSSNDPVNPVVTVVVTLEVIDANVYPYTQNFESEAFPPIGWTMYDVDQDGNAWALSWYNNTPGGQYAAYHGWGNQYQDGWMVSPQISFPTEGFFYLSFYSYVGDVAYYHKNSVMVSTGSGNPADGDFVEVWTTENVVENWTQHYVDLQAYAGQDVYIAFRYEGEFAHFWVFDDVSLGEEIDDSPIMVINTTEINQTVGQDGTGSKSFKILNDGVQNLTFDLSIEYINANGWLSASPVNGSIPGKDNQTISLSFDAAGLELGTYQANINVTSNDTANPTATILATLTVMPNQAVDLDVIYPLYTFPTAVSADGRFVSGSQFGGMNSYLWTKFSGTVDFLGDAQGVSDNGIAAGTYDTEFQHQGIPVSTAGTWSRSTNQWEFLGMNPEVPEIFGSYYNLAFGISADGSTVVGMQWYPDWSVKAYKWSQQSGYEMIGSGIEANNRANGISADGSVIFGWAEPNWTRTPVIWYNGETIYVDQNQGGEAFGASASGNYVTGTLGWGNGFIWSPTEGLTVFENSLNLGTLNPTKVLDDGTVFGYTGEGFPPMPPDRRAFVRHPDGTMETFNDYAAGRGWFEADDWIFYSINDVTPDGDKFIGAAQLPSGDAISFILDLNPGNPVIFVNQTELSENLVPGDTATQVVSIENSGTGLLQYNIVVQYTAAEQKIKPVPTGVEFRSGTLEMASQKTDKLSEPTAETGKTGTVLHYDGMNANSVGLVSGGTFYGAARFPSEMTSVFENYQFESVDVYIDDSPTSCKLIVWDAGTTTAPGAILHQQTFTPTPESWNAIVLDNPLTISGADIWVGLEVTHPAGTFVIGVDGGPGAPDGDWVSLDAINWEHLSFSGLNANWNIRANLSFNGMNWLSVSPVNGVLDATESHNISVSFDAEGLEETTYTANLRISSNDAENPLVIIPVSLLVELGISINELPQDQVKIYPNPVGNYLHIQSNEPIERLSITNYSGINFYTAKHQLSKTILDVSFLNEGMYLLHITTAKGTIAKKFQVVR